MSGRTVDAPKSIQVKSLIDTPYKYLNMRVATEGYVRDFQITNLGFSFHLCESKDKKYPALSVRFSNSDKDFLESVSIIDDWTKVKVIGKMVEWGKGISPVLNPKNYESIKVLH